MSLFKRGYEEASRKEKEIEERKSSNVYRFYLPKNTSTRIIFLDDNPPIYDEHQLQIDGSWKNWFTCKKPFGESCSICEGGTYAYTAGAYSIIDQTEWTDKRGTVHKDEKKLFIAKMATLKKLKQISAKRGGLRGCVFEVTRTDDDKSPTTGDMFDFEEKLTEEELAQYIKKDSKGKPDPTSIQPYDYDEVLAPKDNAEVETKMEQEAENNYNYDEDEINY